MTFCLLRNLRPTTKASLLASFQHHTFWLKGTWRGCSFLRLCQFMEIAVAGYCDFVLTEDQILWKSARSGSWSGGAVKSDIVILDTQWILITQHWERWNGFPEEKKKPLGKFWLFRVFISQTLFPFKAFTINSLSFIFSNRPLTGDALQRLTYGICPLGFRRWRR